MLEVSGKDITELNDADLRTLVARLAIAELRANQHPISSVTAGGNQDAPDGGLDVRVATTKLLLRPDFVPRASTGFQVKASDMPPAAIRNEMRPNGVLRNSIAELAAEGGAYIIVSSKGSVSDGPLAARKEAMKAALAGHPVEKKLAIDFYDRDRIATWTNEYPGIIAWVRQLSGKPLAGWRHMGDWTDTKVGEATEFLTDDKACLVDERSRELNKLTIAEGISQLRDSLGIPGQCVRLVGLSGTGKTRLIQALFESKVGEEALDPSLALYTDYSEEPTPIARDMARQLVDTGQRAILVIDNCNPTTHSDLAKICSSGKSKVSLITVEYDVREDEPESTEVFRLISASNDRVAGWIHRIFPHVSQVDRERIAAFSEGNFRVARALAETLRKGETLGLLKNSELFLRIFQQRNAPDKPLQHAAEDLSLLYSFDGVDTSDAGELAIIARIHGAAASDLFAQVAELRQRGVVQARGKWRAILPQAIANRLASLALKRISLTDFDVFCAALSPRMLKSLSRRLGYLHDSQEARSIVTQWLQPGGRLGDFNTLDGESLRLLANVAPVAPESILKKLKAAITHGSGCSISDERFSHSSTWINLVRAFAYEADMFEDCVEILGVSASFELESNNVNAPINHFRELFHLYLSGTQAPPAARRDAIRKFAASSDPNLHRVAQTALSSLLKGGHFSLTSSIDFGARPRDWGWWPKTGRDVAEWYQEGISLTLDLLDRLPESRSILAGSIRSLWRIPSCRDALEAAASKLVKGGPWIQGWLAVRSTLKYDRKQLEMNQDAYDRLRRLAELLRPTDLLHRARAVILSHNQVYDFSDGEPDQVDAKTSRIRTEELAQELGRALAKDISVRQQFVTEVLESKEAPRAYECGRGLAEGSTDLAAMWSEITTAYKASNPESRNLALLGGFLFQAHQRDPAFCAPVLDAIVFDPQLSSYLPSLQARVVINEDAILRLRDAIHRQATPAPAFYAISNGLIEAAPTKSLVALLKDLSTMPSGVEVAIDILHMRFFCERRSDIETAPHLIAAGRFLLKHANFSQIHGIRDYALSGVIEQCLGGSKGKSTAIKVCRSIRGAFEKLQISPDDFPQSLEAIFKVQPNIALDQFLLPSTRLSRRLFSGDFRDSLLESMEPKTLRAWADNAPDVRYPLLGECIGLFKVNLGNDAGDLSEGFLDLLESAPEKPAFLGDFWRRLHPSSWSGSLADIFAKRRDLLRPLEIHADPSIRKWVTDNLPDLDKWIEEAKTRDRAEEESFE